MRTLGYGLLCVNELLYHCTRHAGNHVIANMVISALPLLLLANLGQGGLCYIAQQLRLSAAGTAVFCTPVHRELYHVPMHFCLEDAMPIK